MPGPSQSMSGSEFPVPNSITLAPKLTSKKRKIRR
jgi:hypothetical protein